jgi:hypothetical protein
MGSNWAYHPDSIATYEQSILSPFSQRDGKSLRDMRGCLLPGMWIEEGIGGRHDLSGLKQTAGDSG